MPVDRLQMQISVGDVVNIPIVVTAIGGTDARPTVTGSSKYAGFDGSTDVITTVDAIQCVKDTMVPKS
jgi:hypothetical protein